MSSALKNWSRPALVVLGRGRPEESVLEICKNHQIQLTAVDKVNCGWKPSGGSSGHPCHGVTGS